MKIIDNIYSVGVVDADIRMFHGYQTPIGTTYNAYLIVDEQITLVDFVKAPFAKQFAKNISNIIGDRPIDNIISNHVEPDHSGAMPYIMSLYPKAKVYGTANCLKGLKAYYPNCQLDFHVVKAGDSLNTGKYDFQFIPMPMVHWPDSMSTYLPQEKIIFSNDALGQHIGTGEIFDYDLTLDKLLDRAQDYYANIVLPFGMQVNKLLGAASALDINWICPSHGVILKDHIAPMVESYQRWANNVVDEFKAVIIYDTMWGTTHKMALCLQDEYQQKGIRVELIKLSDKHHSYAMAQLIDAKYIFVGSPTLNNQMMPTVAAFLTYMIGLKPKGRIGLAFGSYGWSGEAPAQINTFLEKAGFELLGMQKAQWNI
jgi:flavorubredoxin